MAGSGDFAARSVTTRQVLKLARHFIVVTDAGEKKGRSTAEQFEQIQNFFRQSLAIGTNQPIPFVKILAAENEHTMREVLPPGFWSPGHARLAGEFIHHDDKYFAPSNSTLNAPHFPSTTSTIMLVTDYHLPTYRYGWRKD